MEIMARVVAIMRRLDAVRRWDDQQTIQCGDLSISPAAYEVFLGSDRLVLTPTEFRLLYILAKNRHVTLRSNFIQSVVWGDEVQSGDALKKYIQRLRRKLGDDPRNPTWIKNIYGIGYRFSPVR